MNGDFRLVPELSVADVNFVHVFPRNIELEGRLTFVGARPGPEVNNIAPVSGNVSFVVRHSLVALPEPGYAPRRFDPRAGSFGMQVVDFGAPLGRPVVYELANRFRLEHSDPNDPHSPVRNPIIFYIDRAAPEPIRSALREGVSWWAEAFAAAGWPGAFRAEILPEGADPLDLRYNVVNWVNRATRGWSYGQPIVDPRTGEIIRGQVLLGSLRVRQDLLIYQALVGAGLTGTGDPNDPITAALARIRQLGAHEVGHALGFAHNFAASIQGRYSVMDYPAPRVRLVNGGGPISPTPTAPASAAGTFSRSTGSTARRPTRKATGAWRGARAGAALRRRRRQPPGRCRAPARQPVGRCRRSGGRAGADDGGARRRGRPLRPGGAQPGRAARAAAPRLRADLAAPPLPGRGGGEIARRRRLHLCDGRRRPWRGMRPVPAAAQRRALAALLATLSPQALTVPPPLLAWLSAGWSGDGDRQTEIEVMPAAGGPVFDPLAASEVGAMVTLTDLLAPQRLNRLEIQHQADPASPSAAEAIDALLARVFAFTGLDPAAAAVQRRIATTTALALARVQRDGSLSPTIALALSERLARLAATLSRAPDDWSRGLGRLLGDRDALTAALADQRRLPRIPPGMPIGAEGEDWPGL
jgi:hypothetical protein